VTWPTAIRFRVTFRFRCSRRRQQSPTIVILSASPGETKGFRWCAQVRVGEASTAN
jgi:hypothetical protein